ncbi:Beta-mannosidase B [Tolypocladium capitatum]|uniref:Beta-mannosidase B n=1 Tax=Tolypocladium capitatum TaxID=45235 RepID=A0A2K3QHD4_9HYPO|nr:Beta-mannosidase B [Tolypocladium capitatum]
MKKLELKGFEKTPDSRGWAVVDCYLVPEPAYFARTYQAWTQTGCYVDENSQLCTGQVDQTPPARHGMPLTPGSRAAARGSSTHTSPSSPRSPLQPSIPDADDPTEPFGRIPVRPLRRAHRPVRQRPTDTAWPGPVKFLDMADRGVGFAVSPAGDDVVVSARRPVQAFVFEEALKPSDAGFDIMPGETQRVKVKGGLMADRPRRTYVDVPSASLQIRGGRSRT